MSSADAIGGVRSLFADDEFHARHLGPSVAEETAMLAALGYAARQDLIAATVPAAIRLAQEPDLPAPATEAAACEVLRRPLVEEAEAEAVEGRALHHRSDRTRVRPR